MDRKMETTMLSQGAWLFSMAISVGVTGFISIVMQSRGPHTAGAQDLQFRPHGFRVEGYACSF